MSEYTLSPEVYQTSSKKTPQRLRYSQNPQTHTRGVHTQLRDHIPTSGDYRQLQIPQVSSRDPKPQSENTNAAVVTADASQVTQSQFGGQWSMLTDPTPTLWDPNSVKACPGHITGVLDPYMKTQSHHSIPIPITGNQNLLGPLKSAGKPDILRIATLRSRTSNFMVGGSQLKLWIFHPHKDARKTNTEDDKST